MKLRTLLLSLLLIAAITIKAQIPAGYYNNAENLKGFQLKTALYNIIKGHTDNGYSALWGFYSSYEKDFYYENDGTILDMYSENPGGADPYNFTPGSSQCGTYSGEGSCYNREHSFPQSWFSSLSPMRNDVHHVFPTDGQVNSYRDSYPYGVVGSATRTSANGSKVGAAKSDLGYSGTVFEPLDEFKGDFARAQFYMATRYENVIASWENNGTANVVLNGTSDQVYKDWYLELLFTWHKYDPVSQKEIDRNNAAYNFQDNRNPFVDHPEYVDSIWFPEGSGIVVIPIDPQQDTCIKMLFPTSIDNPTWYEVEFSGNDTHNYSTHHYRIYRLIGDTTIAARVYSKLMMFENPNDHVSMAQYVGAIRSDTCGSTYYIPKNKNEYLLYDFSKEVGDTIHSDFLKDDLHIDYYEVVSVDSVDIEGIGLRKRMVVESKEGTGTWIEGIGSSKGLLWPVLPGYYYLSTMHNTVNNYGRLLLCNYQFNKEAYKQWEGDCYYQGSSGTLASKQDFSDVKIYPNPTRGNLTIDLLNKKDVVIKAYNQLGQEVMYENNANGVIKKNVAEWNEGVYQILLFEATGELIGQRTILIY